jgi:SAM-dependent methyltransferase
MSDWQERITHETAPAIRVEHELRYRAAVPLILAGGPWADLGCGNGLAAAAALGRDRPPYALLVDVEEHAVARAAEELGMPEAGQLAGDLTDPKDLHRIGEMLLSAEGAPVVTCFEVVEHLSSFLALVEWSSEMARAHGATVVLSVPNDAFWSIQNPHHLTAWGEGAFEEMRRLLPAEHTLLRQVALSGSALLGWDATPVAHELSATTGGEGTVATHFIAAFGPLHEDLWRGALAAQTDTLDQRRWERQRDSDVAIAFQIADENRAAVKSQEQTIATQAQELRSHARQFEEWRTYIHELERALGRPLSGSTAAVTPEESPTAPTPEGSQGGSAGADSGAGDRAEPPA